MNICRHFRRLIPIDETTFIFRSSRTEPPDLANIMRVTDDMIDSLVCPPPPSDPPIMSEEMISGLIVPAPGWSEFYLN